MDRYLYPRKTGFSGMLVVILFGLTLGIGYGGQAESNFKLHSIAIVGNSAMASLSIADGPAYWYSVGSQISAYRVANINGFQNTVVLKSPGGDTVTLVLPLEKITALRTADFFKQDYDWSKSAPGLPYHVLRNWNNLSETERSAYLNFYLHHGWIIKVTVLAPGVTSTTYESIGEQQREDQVIRKIAAFKAMLNSTQLAQYNDLSSSTRSRGALSATNGSENREERIRIFLNQLTTAQLNAYTNLFVNKADEFPVVKVPVTRKTTNEK